MTVWTLEKALDEMIALWERVHPGVPLGKPTLNSAKRALELGKPLYSRRQLEERLAIVERERDDLATVQSPAKKGGGVDLLKEAMQFCCKVDCDGDTLNVGLARRIAAYLDAIRAEANQPAQGEGGKGE